MRRANFERYQTLLAGLPGLSFMPEASFGRCTRWLVCAQLDPKLFGQNQEAICAALEAENIETRPVWKPLHLQPLFANCETVGGHVAESLYARGICLPSGSNLEPEEIERVCAIIRALVR
jgi:pyridoxal phosphate-dependent aminotransferase EpsN